MQAINKNSEKPNFTQKEEKGENEQGYQTDSETLVTEGRLNADSQTQESTVSYNSWAFDVKDSRLVKI